VGSIHDSPLGKATHYSEAYDPGLLYPVLRAPQRELLGLSGALPFHGSDLWTAWELSWLDAAGKPQVAIARFEVPCTTPRIVESKSVKLYLTALNGTAFPGPGAIVGTLVRDLSSAVGGAVAVELRAPQDWPARAELAGQSIDGCTLPTIAPAPDAQLLRTGGRSVSETLTSRLFRSLCPVTGQPDYADIQIRYSGAALDRAALLGYLVAYRHHAGFHEHCVEQMFVDLLRACAPSELAVLARFTRRGGVDINPWRAMGPDWRPPDAATSRQ
jgi:7-cyano-7-deazaguanine reductase